MPQFGVNSTVPVVGQPATGTVVSTPDAIINALGVNERAQLGLRSAQGRTTTVITPAGDAVRRVTGLTILEQVQLAQLKAEQQSLEGQLQVAQQQAAARPAVVEPLLPEPRVLPMWTADP